MDDETQGAPAEDATEAADTSNTDAGADSTSASSSKAPYVEPLAAGKVIHIPIEDIDLDDVTFKFRFSLRVGALQESIKRDGQQLPVIVRKLPKRSGHKYQLISGFRRVTAIKELGWDTVAAMVREDLDDDAAALRASVLENTARKTYSDIDRAYVIQTHLSQGHTVDQLAELMRLSKKQVKNLLSLIELPAEAKAAIDDPGIRFDATHALILRRFENVHGKGSVDWLQWIGRVTTEGLSVSKLTRALNETLKGKEREPVGDVLRGESDLTKGIVRLNPIKFVVADLTDEERVKLRAELEGILKLI